MMQYLIRRSVFVLLCGLLVLPLFSACEAAPAQPNGDVTTSLDAAATEPAEPAELDLLSAEHAYVIVRDEDCGQAAVSAVVSLRSFLGSTHEIATDWVKRGEEPVFGEYEILIGRTNRPESAELGEGLGMYDYRIAVIGDKLVIAGGSDDALCGALAAFMRDERVAEGKVPADYRLDFDGADNRDEYIANPDGFIANWTLDFDVPDWMTDFEEKIAAFADADGRLMSSVHRGDFKHYPENSIEGIISAIQMGADNVELDLRLTRDGVVVLMHDASLKRTTDWSAKAGKNGLPASENLADWSFAELRQLRLRMNDGKQTDYLIPTFEEALTVCSERTTIRLDKPDVWDWDRDIWPLVQKTEAWRACIINYHFGLAKEKRVLEEIRTASGKEALFFHTFNNGGRADWYGTMTQLQTRGYFPIAKWTSYKGADSEASIKAVLPYLKQVAGKMRIYVDSQALAGADESPATWERLNEAGLNFLLIDDGLAFAQYIAENCSPTPYA